MYDAWSDLTFWNICPAKFHNTKLVDFGIRHTIQILTHYNCTAVFTQTLHRPHRWHLVAQNACALDGVELLHEICSAADDVDDILWFSGEFWFWCSCVFARCSLLIQSLSHSLGANFVFLAEIWYDFFCDVLRRNLLETDLLEHIFRFTFPVKNNLGFKRKFSFKDIYMLWYFVYKPLLLN